ncbi:CPBP family intramembrane glutamic endopeptidase [Caulobacter sp.]|uniref:CPBP family intramembrane glutamic endopeptidase n=1 Tax=Caulobacter sp. TaxID=78 RepID=UPI002B49ED7C|nr:CPBP family intramembrane glutamic endopeptidase [Caulobacter sp.]HJV41210.1 CPBP family intramembrane glutamic endopeptidase [Caulobacter sp.]
MKNRKPLADPPRPGWGRVLAGFALLFAVYQTAEGLQTVFAPGDPLGPVLMVASVLIAWPVGRWLGWRGYDAFGLDASPASLPLLWGGMLLALLAKLASLSAGVGAGLIVPSASPPAGLTLATVALGALMTFVPSVAEDIITRGFLLRALPVRLGFWAYVLGSAALFTANHVWRFDWGVSEQVRLFCCGLAYGAAAWRWRTLWGAVALHWGWNFANALAGASIPLEVRDAVEGRYLSAAVHLALFVVVLCLPSRRSAPEASA